MEKYRHLTALDAVDPLPQLGAKVQRLVKPPLNTYNGECFKHLNHDDKVPPGRPTYYYFTSGHPDAIRGLTGDGQERRFVILDDLEVQDYSEAELRAVAAAFHRAFDRVVVTDVKQFKERLQQRISPDHSKEQVNGGTVTGRLTSQPQFQELPGAEAVTPSGQVNLARNFSKFAKTQQPPTTSGIYHVIKGGFSYLQHFDVLTGWSALRLDMTGQLAHWVNANAVAMLTNSLRLEAPSVLNGVWWPISLVEVA